MLEPILVTIRVWEKGILKEEITIRDYMVVKKPKTKQPTLDDWGK